MMQFFNTYSLEIYAFLLSMLPVSEIRGTIILFSHRMNPITLLIVGILGNMLPVPLVLLLFRPVLAWLRKTKLFSGFANWLENRVQKKAAGFMKLTVVALCIFVGIPLPGTGAWTGAMLAAMLDMRLKYSIPAIFLGVVIAGIIMTLLMQGILNFGVFTKLFIN